MVDCNSLRDFLQERWCDYTDGLLSLSVVSMVTNSAIKLLQKMEKQLLCSVPERFHDYKTVAFALVTEGALSHVDYDKLVDECRSVGKSDKIDWSECGILFSVKQSVALSAHQLMEDFLKHTVRSVRLHYTMAPIWEEIQKKRYNNQHPGYGQSSLSKRGEGDQFTFSEFVTEMCFRSCTRVESRPVNRRAPPVLDELSRGLKEMIKSEKTPM